MVNKSDTNEQHNFDEQTRRLFIGIALPDDTKDQLIKIVNPFKEKFTGIRWVKSDNYHITLKFLGNTKQSPIEIKNRLESKIKVVGVPEFQLSLTTLGAFIRRSAFVFVAVKEVAPLLQLYHITENAMAAFGIAREKRPFFPHITIGRVKSHNKEALKKLIHLPKQDLSLPAAKVSELTLFQSRIRKSGSLCKPLYTLGLA